MALILVAYLVVDVFIEQAAALAMLVPIFVPLAMQCGIDLVQFGLFTCLTLAFGLVTPPVGLCLFVAAGIAGVPVARVVRAAVPHLVAMMMVILLVGFIPQIYLWLPRWFGF